MGNISSVQQNVLLFNNCTNYVRYGKKSTIPRQKMNKSKIRKGEMFWDNAWFTFSTNVSRQNNTCPCNGTEVSVYDLEIQQMPSGL
jgi:hypothetical protein